MSPVKIISTSEVRKDISEIVNEIRYNNKMFAIGRHGRAEVLLMKYPDNYNSELGDITNFNANSDSFDFLRDEPNLYSLSDLKKRYV